MHEWHHCAVVRALPAATYMYNHTVVPGDHNFQTTATNSSTQSAQWEHHMWPSTFRGKPQIHVHSTGITQWCWEITKRWISRPQLRTVPLKSFQWEHHMLLVDCVAVAPSYRNNMCPPRKEARAILWPFTICMHNFVILNLSRFGSCISWGYTCTYIQLCGKGNTAVASMCTYLILQYNYTNRNYMPIHNILLP